MDLWGEKGDFEQSDLIIQNFILSLLLFPKDFETNS